VCAGDYDNDGWVDLVVTFWGHNVLLHNNGDGTFADVTRKAGLWDDNVRWATGCAFLDYDRDGRLGLFISHYVDLDPKHTPEPGSSSLCQWKGIPVMCGPRGLKGTHNQLYHNNGDGTFTDVSEKSGVAKTPEYYAFTVLTLDYDDDGWPDIHHNNHDGTFSDVTLDAGLGSNTQFLGWGTLFVDTDNDGHPDLFIANSHVYPEVDKKGLNIAFKERKILYWNEGNGRFQDISARAGPGITGLFNSHGVAAADFDIDGAVEIAVNNSHDRPSLL